jgi:hypothetical protein
MATNKNITMKNYNGTDYDTLYPKTQTTQVLGNWDLTKVSGLLDIANGGTGTNSLDTFATTMGLPSEYVRYAMGYYTGTGTYGESNKNSLNFDFYPLFVSIKPIDNNTVYSGSTTYDVTYVGQSNSRLYVSGRTLYWYGISVDSQLNKLGDTYCYICFGISVPTKMSWLLTSSGTFTVPLSGNYYLELHGGGGGANYDYSHTGGGSGQVYSSIYLTAGIYNVTIGKGGESSINAQATAGGATSFGSYSVQGGNFVPTSASAVSGVGNVGGASKTPQITSDSYSTVYLVNPLNGGGKFPGYGAGGACAFYSSTTYTFNGWDGCVYIEYLDA